MLDLDQLRRHIRSLHEGDDASRRQAIHSLKDYDEQAWATAPPEAIRPLVESLRTQLISGVKDLSIRQKVLTILGNLGPRSKPAVPELIELLKEGTPDGIRAAAATVLGKIGGKAKGAVDQLVAVLTHGQATLVIAAVRALSDIGCADQRVRSALVNLWLSPTQSPDGHIQVALALCKLQMEARDLSTVLTRTLVANAESSIRKMAAEALAWRSDNEADVVPALLTATLSDEDETVRQAAAASLARLRLSHDDAIRLCAKQIKDSLYAETALKNSGQGAVAALIEVLGGEEPAAREKAARTLGCLGEGAGEAVLALATALHDQHLDVRLAAAKSLWNVTKNAEVVVPVLVDLLEEHWAAAPDASESRRRHLQTVIEALWRMGPLAKGAVPALMKMAKDKKRHISETALRALRVIAPTEPNKAGSW